MRASIKRRTARWQYPSDFYIGLFLVGLILLPVLIGLFYLPYDPDAMEVTAKNLPPSLSHLFGTDQFGRDVFSRVLEGARTTFFVGAATVFIGAVGGLLIGAVTGYFGGLLDELLMRVNDSVAAFPSVLLALVMVSLFGTGKYKVILALGVLFIPSFARVVRSEFLARREADYVKNARLMGAGTLRILFFQILPNTRAILLSALAIGFNNAVLAEAGLSYLSLGVQPPDASLGRMLSEAQSYLPRALAPGLTIVCTVLGFSLIGEGLSGRTAYRKHPVQKKPSRADAARASAEKAKKQEVKQAGQTVAEPTSIEQAGQTVAEPTSIEQAGQTVAEPTSIEPAGQTVTKPTSTEPIGQTVAEKAKPTGIAAAGQTTEESAKPTSTEPIGQTVAGCAEVGMAAITPLLSVQGLCVAFREKQGLQYVVRDAALSVGAGEMVGVVGESGSGKTMTALAIMGLLKAGAKITKGAVFFEGQQLRADAEATYRALRGSRMAMIFQEPMTALNPVLTIEDQVEELLLLHERASYPSKAERRRRVTEVLGEVGLKQPETLLRCYPHQLSGGMRQRVCIAMAMICRPRLLIADEPTTALDVTTQAKILRLLRKLNQEYNVAILLISHNLNIVKSMCKRVIVMRDGRIVEQNDTSLLFQAPIHPYTKQLLTAAQLPVFTQARAQGEGKETKTNETGIEQNLLRADRVSVFYRGRRKGLFHRPAWVEVVKEVSLRVKHGEIVGLVGESGSGKSSFARAVVGLQQRMEGTVQMNGIRPQMVFQDPYGSLNPSYRVGRLLEEPLRLNTTLNRQARRTRIVEMLQKVGLSEAYAERYPSELSGGQRQRVAIAMALILNQELIVLDEPVSALDVTVQVQILELLLKLRKEENLSYLFISHDMRVIRAVCDYVCVMVKGEIVETARTEELFAHPRHSYTKELLQASEY